MGRLAGIDAQSDRVAQDWYCEPARTVAALLDVESDCVPLPFARMWVSSAILRRLRVKWTGRSC
jgi:hypothetical protein